MTDALGLVCPKCKGKVERWPGVLCKFCQSRLTSVHAQVALAQGEPLTPEQREWLFAWFYTTRYFAFHRRMSRGRAKKLIERMSTDLGAESANPANVSIRGPHDLVTDSAPATSLPVAQ